MQQSFSILMTKLFDGLEKCLPLWNYLSKEGKKKTKRWNLYSVPYKTFSPQTNLKGFMQEQVQQQVQHLQFNYNMVLLAWKYYNCNVNFTLEDYNVAFDSALSAVDFFAEKEKN